MSEIEPEWLFFPIRNEDGFKVTGLAEYKHMINTIIQAQVELAKDYPGDTICVYYEVEGD